MEWATADAGDALIARPTGRIDEGSWQPFAEALGKAVADAGGRDVLLDLAGVDYMSSRGLRALTIARKAASDAGVEIILAAPNDRMREILAISRYDKIFKIIDTVASPR